MKKLFCMLLAALMLVSLCACGDDAGANPTNPADGPKPNEDGFVLVYKGQQLRIHAEFAPILAALGKPVTYTESASCAFDGLDKTYYYGNLYIDTYPVGDKDYIYDFWFADDSLSTPEGIYIGATKAQVEKAYGAECFNGKSAYIITKADESLTIIVENDVVTSIQYSLVLG